MEQYPGRLRDIFKILKKDPHATAERVDQILEQKYSFYRKAKEKGAETEKLARKKISELEFTNKAYIISDKNNFDCCGCDIRVEFDPNKLRRWLGNWVSIPNGFFYLQVKSSDFFVNKYQEETEGKSGEALLRKKIIVVNGRNEDEDFEKSVREELAILNEYWRSRRSRKR